MSSTQTETVVQAPLNFWKPPKDGGELMIPAWVAGQTEFNRQTVNFHDVRGREADFTLDKNGFQFIRAPTTFDDWYNDEAVWKQYFPSIEDTILKATGATKVFFFRYRLRDSSLASQTKTQEGAAEYPHVDLALHAAPTIAGSMPDLKVRVPDWDTLKKSRWGMLSFWRPINTVTRNALCVCDYSTIPEADLKTFTLGMGPNYTGPPVQSHMINYNPEHQWYYKSKMEKDDVVIIKNYDSKKDGRARYGPHGSFKSPDDYGEPRKSIESRCFVFWEGESTD